MPGGICLSCLCFRSSRVRVEGRGFQYSVSVNFLTPVFSMGYSHSKSCFSSQLLKSVGLCLLPNLGSSHYFFEYFFSPTFFFSPSGTLKTRIFGFCYSSIHPWGSAYFCFLFSSLFSLWGSSNFYFYLQFIDCFLQLHSALVCIHWVYFSSCTFLIPRLLFFFICVSFLYLQRLSIPLLRLLFHVFHIRS